MNVEEVDPLQPEEEDGDEISREKEASVNFKACYLF